MVISEKTGRCFLHPVLDSETVGSDPGSDVSKDRALQTGGS